MLSLTRSLTALSVAGVLLVSSVSAGMYPVDGPVVNLDAKGFKKVMASEHASMVAFVAPWCGHCKSMTPEYTKAAQSLAPLIPFYAIDCDASPNKALCAEHGIQGFPTIKAFPKASKGAARDYQGERKSKALINHAVEMIPDKVKKLRISEGQEPMSLLMAALGENPSIPHALLVHPAAPSVPLMWKVLASRLGPKIKLAYIKDTPDKSVIKALGLAETSPTGKDNVRIVTWTNGEMLAYDGQMKFDPLLKFLTPLANGDVNAATAAASAEATTDPSVAAQDAAAKRARLQAKWDEEEKRDAKRRAKMGSKVESAPEAVEEPEVVPATKGSGKAAEEPMVPQAPEVEFGAPEVEETARGKDEL